MLIIIINTLLYIIKLNIKSTLTMASNNAIQRIGEIQKQLEFDVADIKKVESGNPITPIPYTR